MSESFVTPEGRLRYARSLWAARRFKNNPANDAKFSCSLIIDKNNPQIGALIEQYNVVALTVEGAVQNAPGALVTLPYGKKTSLMDGAVRFPGDAFYADKLILGCSRSEGDGAPDVRGVDNNPVVDKGEVYDGCNAVILLNFYAYAGGTGGINAGLHAVRKTGDNDRLGNAAPDAATAFANIPVVAAPQPQVGVPAQPGGVQIAQPGQPGVAPVGQYPVQPVPPQQAYQQPVQQFVQPSQQPLPAVGQQPPPPLGQQPVYQQPVQQPVQQFVQQGVPVVPAVDDDAQF